ncbi:hypothetical protein BDV97DRAFT_310299 [Delphinella strobiligena]|nr:hypothetical protein BDV97DRAFT_310299 [Delphinella strobiligena]
MSSTSEGCPDRPDRLELRWFDAVGGGIAATHSDLRDLQKDSRPSIDRKLSARSVSVPNFSRVLQGQSFVSTEQKLTRINPTSRYSMIKTGKASVIKRWDPRLRTCLPWDGLRRDEELWSRDGDCAVHLCGKGRSKRGPSFRISSAALRAANCTGTSGSASSSSPSHGERLTPSNSFVILCDDASRIDGGLELYIAAPDNVLREDALRWHLATRNFFAWLTNKPVVGVSLGAALIDLYDRMRLFRPESDNLSDFTTYAESLGYLNFVNCPDYALAFLQFAEHNQTPGLWTDAFAHCVGMHDQISLSSEFDATSIVTKALMARAYLEMDLHLGRVSRALRTFLEDELSSANFGLPVAAQSHMEHFRSFLHSFYVNKFGYWPYEQGSTFSKSLLLSMYAEFHQLYEFMVDKGSSNSIHNQTGSATGGICVRQNIDAFNQRHSYDPLPHTLPLIPEYPKSRRVMQSQRTLRSFKLGAKQPSDFERKMTVQSALAMATNSAQPEVLVCPLVKDYILIEHEWSINPEERVSVADARKVRWIVIYSILQMLISATRAPKEVRDTGISSYHMCLLTTGTPPWGAQTNLSPFSQSTANGPAIDNHARSQLCAKANADGPLSIQPDCELEDYLPKRSFSEACMKPAPLRINTGLVSRRDSIKSFHKNIISSRSKRNSSSISPLTSIAADSVSTTDNGNGLVSTAFQSSSATCTPVNNTAPPSQSLRFLQPSDHENLIEEARTPILDVFTFDPSGDSDSPSSIQSSRPSSFTSIDAFGWTSGDDKRNSRVYSMDHESVYSSGNGSILKSGDASYPTSPSTIARSASGYFAQTPSPQASRGRSGSTKGDQTPDSHALAECLRDVQRMNLPGFYDTWLPASTPEKEQEVSLLLSAVAVPGQMARNAEAEQKHQMYQALDMLPEETPDVHVQIAIHQALDLLPERVLIAQAL